MRGKRMRKAFQKQNCKSTTVPAAIEISESWYRFQDIPKKKSQSRAISIPIFNVTQYQGRIINKDRTLRMYVGEMYGRVR